VFSAIGIPGRVVPGVNPLGSFRLSLLEISKTIGWIAYVCVVFKFLPFLLKSSESYKVTEPTCLPTVVVPISFTSI